MSDELSIIKCYSKINPWGVGVGGGGDMALNFSTQNLIWLPSYTPKVIIKQIHIHVVKYNLKQES